MQRIFYLVFGFVSMMVGVIGIVLQIVPKNTFLLLSCFCFARSSKRYEKWLSNTKMYQFYVADYVETKYISRKRKKQIIWQIYLLMAISIWLAPILLVKMVLGLLT
ncbi:YbaN family protein, partial [Streptococcus suis]